MNTFSMKKRIYYHDTDCGGVVYYANYLKYFEEARTEHLRSIGIDIAALGAREELIFTVKEVNLKYKSPARYGDEVTVSSSIEKIKPASILFHQEIKKGEKILVECSVLLVTIDKNFKPVVIPKEICERIRDNKGL